MSAVCRHRYSNNACIMPINNSSQLARFSATCGAKFRWLRLSCKVAMTRLHQGARLDVMALCDRLAGRRLAAFPHALITLALIYYWALGAVGLFCQENLRLYKRLKIIFMGAVAVA
jgi:hypothetical protein